MMLADANNESLIDIQVETILPTETVIESSSAADVVVAEVAGFNIDLWSIWFWVVLGITVIVVYWILRKIIDKK